MTKNTNLTLRNRIAIEVGLREQKSFSVIAADLRKDPTTIFKEVCAHITLRQTGGCNPCVVRKDCKHYGDVCPPASLFTESLAAPAIRQNTLKPVPTSRRHNAPS